MTDIEEGNAENVVAKKSAPKKVVKTDSSETVDKIKSGSSVLLMTSAGGSWTTPSGVTFSKDKPYQLVPNEEIESLLASGRFRRAEPQEVKDFYKIEL